MSRSYKKNPILKYAPSSKRGGVVKAKRAAARVARATTQPLPEGSYYKRLYPQWDIHDIVSRWTWASCVRSHYRRRVHAWYRERDADGPDWNYWARHWLRK